MSYNENPHAIYPILPSQLPRPQKCPPSKKLQIAIITDAAEIIYKCRNHDHEHRGGLLAETIFWVQSDDRIWPFSFVNLCESLGLDVSAARKAILRGVKMPSKAQFESLIGKPARVVKKRRWKRKTELVKA